MAIDKAAFGEALRSWRKSSSMTLKDVKVMLEVRGYPYTVQAISAWERGESAPPAHVVRAVEAHIGVASGTLGIHLGYPAGDPLSDRLEWIEARQDQQEATLREIREQLAALLQASAPPKRARR